MLRAIMEKYIYTKCNNKWHCNYSYGNSMNKLKRNATENKERNKLTNKQKP